MDITTQYTVTIGDFRRASYYGLVIRFRKILLIASIMVGASVCYGLATLAGFGTPNPVVFFIGAAYLIWILLLCAGNELTIRNYLKSRDCLIGCEFRAVISEKRLLIRIPARKVRAEVPLEKLAYAFELSASFLFYTNASQVYILPHRAISADERTAIRGWLASAIGERFHTRFH